MVTLRVRGSTPLLQLHLLREGVDLQFEMKQPVLRVRDVALHLLHRELPLFCRELAAKFGERTVQRPETALFFQVLLQLVPGHRLAAPLLLMRALDHGQGTLIGNVRCKVFAENVLLSFTAKGTVTQSLRGRACKDSYRISDIDRE